MIVLLLVLIVYYYYKRYPFISVNDLQSYESYVIGGGNNHFGG